jgi:hypothetical protein
VFALEAIRDKLVNSFTGLRAHEPLEQRGFPQLIIDGFEITTQPQVLVKLFGQRSSKRTGRLGRGGFRVDVIFCLDQCDALAMHGGHAKLGLPCQSASPADSYSCRLWREVLGVVLKQRIADLSCADDAKAFLQC